MEDEKSSSFFDDYDKENGYGDDLDIFELTDLLYNIYDFAIREQKMSFKDCEDMDFIAYIDYIDYLFNRKPGKEVIE